jgi:hypothetical protein
MKRLTRCAVTAVACAGLASVSMSPVLAEGKAQLGCSSPYTQSTIEDIVDDSEELITAGLFTEEALRALLASIDHNGNVSLCVKTPHGWYGPPATSGAHKEGFVNLVDDKMIDS